jgi:hypothetical protein
LLAVCEEALCGCDVTIGIQVSRDGSPAQDPLWVSCRQLKFSTATREKIPRLVFRMDEESERLAVQRAEGSQLRIPAGWRSAGGVASLSSTGQRTLRNRC